MFYFLLAMRDGEGTGALPNSSADTSNVSGALFALPPPPPLDFMIRTQQKSGRSLSKLGRITQLP